MYSEIHCAGVVWDCRKLRTEVSKIVSMLCFLSFLLGIEVILCGLKFDLS